MTLSSAIDKVNEVIDTTVPQTLNNEVVRLLNGEDLGKFAGHADLKTALMELLRRQEIDQKTIRTVTEQRADMQQGRAELQASYSEYRNTVIEDFTRISESLNTSADENSLCEEYDQAIVKANSVIRGSYELDPRTKEFTVTMTVTASVTAMNDAAAKDLVSDDPDSYVDWSYADYHVEED